MCRFWQGVVPELFGIVGDEVGHCGGVEGGVERMERRDVEGVNVQWSQYLAGRATSWKGASAFTLCFS